MKRPWQIWTVFGLCLAVASATMGWLTVTMLALDRAEAAARRDEQLARQQAELEERLSQALWRMDTALTPLIAQEAARPYFVYRSFYAAPGEAPADERSATGTKTAQPKPRSDHAPSPVPSVPSPLLAPPSPYVLVHFQVGSDGQWSSPQSPGSPAMCQLALGNGATPDSMRNGADRLAELRGAIDRDALLFICPQESLPPLAHDAQWLGNAALGNPDANVAPPPNASSSGAVQSSTVQSSAVQSGANAFNSSAYVDTSQQRKIEQQQGERQSAGQAPAQRAQSVRDNNDWESRNRIVQNYAQQALVGQRVGAGTRPLTLVSEGVSRPVWIGGQLLLARRVTHGKEVTIQGCALDWRKLKSLLVSEVADLLPHVDLRPVPPDHDAGEFAPNRMLATLPVQVVVPRAEVEPSRPTSIRLSLSVAWGCLGVAALSVAVLLSGVVTLSERRGAFVSAVTHELRTPLTTFRLYTDMLAQGMVADEARRTTYLDTLRAEADRLGHLVENVLSFARLERRRDAHRAQRMSLRQILDVVAERLRTRAQQAGMDLTIGDEASAEVPADAENVAGAENIFVHVDPSAVEQILYNLVDNACKYAAAAADKRIHIETEQQGRWAVVRVRDHGDGVPPSAVRRLFRPFSKTTCQAAPNAPGVGLGLALSRRLARNMRGDLRVVPMSIVGACFELRLPHVK